MYLRLIVTVRKNQYNNSLFLNWLKGKMKFNLIFLLYLGLLTHLQVFAQNIKFTEKSDEFVNRASNISNMINPNKPINK